jgi:hypothetical protein
MNNGSQSVQRDILFNFFNFPDSQYLLEIKLNWVPDIARQRRWWKPISAISFKRNITDSDFSITIGL